MKRWIAGMRDAFSKALYETARTDSRIMLVTSDTGAICHDQFRSRLKGQYLNVGIAEQNMVGVAAGLALSGKKVCVYAIVPFATMRCYEQIRVDLCCMNLPVTVVGIGAGYDYSTLGPTHHGTEDIALMRALPGMSVYSPADSLTADRLARILPDLPGPKYIRLDRTGYPAVYREPEDLHIEDGLTLLRPGRDLMIVATGRMTLTALQVARDLAKKGVRAGVVDLFRIQPLNESLLLRYLDGVPAVVTLEEHFVSGGIGTVVAELLIAQPSVPRFKPIGLPHRFCRRYGSRAYLLAFNGVDAESVTRKILDWVNPSRKASKARNG